jgi:hypothetical protein
MKYFVALFCFLIASYLFSGCKDVGFRELDVSAKSRASVQTAREVMAQVQQGLRAFYDAKHRFPETTDANLYDSIRNYMGSQIDPIDLYRNDNGKGYFIAVGARSERVIYRYPPTLGVGDYTLYWVGQNGVDEEGEGDDVDAWQSAIDTVRKFERQRPVDLQNERDPDRLRLIRSGADIYRDSIRFEIMRHDSVFYADSWPISAYFKNRPELTDAERKQLVRTELDRFFTQGAFVHTDSLAYRNWPHLGDFPANSPEMAEIVHSGEAMFNYYAGNNLSKGVAWLKSKKKFVVVWKS